MKFLAFILLLTLTDTVKAQGFPTANPPIILWSAKACYAEALWSEADCAALLHVIRKRSDRYHWPFLKMLKEYSVVNWIHENKTAPKLKLGTNTGKGLTKAWNERWKALVMHVVDILTGRVDDPCPIADHWAATFYAPRSPMRRVKCNVHTANQFWVSVNKVKHVR